MTKAVTARFIAQRLRVLCRPFGSHCSSRPWQRRERQALTPLYSRSATVSSERRPARTWRAQMGVSWVGWVSSDLPPFMGLPISDSDCVRQTRAEWRPAPTQSRLRNLSSRVVTVSDSNIERARGRAVPFDRRPSDVVRPHRHQRVRERPSGRVRSLLCLIPLIRLAKPAPWSVFKRSDPDRGAGFVSRGRDERRPTEVVSEREPVGNSVRLRCPFPTAERRSIIDI